jgi:hypothetical protein
LLVRTFVVLALFTGTAIQASRAQAVPIADPETNVTAAASTNDSGPDGIIPHQRGVNLSLATTSQHDSANGWSSLLSPDLAYRFNRYLSADVSVPIYDYINVLVTSGTKAAPIYTAATKRLALGDTSLNGHLDLVFHSLSYNATATLGLPSGNSKYGLGSGQVTYSFNNHFEKSFGFLTPNLELGIGDSSSLVDARIRKNYVSVGKLAHFQAGLDLDLPFNMSFETDMYEELPVSSQTIFSTTGKGKKKKTTSTTSSAAEDNGFSNSLDIPLNRHVTLSGFYNRSLRSHSDTAGFSLTFLLKAPPRRTDPQ